MFELASFLTAIFSLFLGIFVYYKNPYSTQSRAWARVSLAVALWSVGLFGVVSVNSKQIALAFQFILDVAAIAIPALYLHFTYILLKKPIRNQGLLKVTYIAASFLTVISLSPLYKTDLVSIFSFNFWIKPGPLYILFPIYFTLVMIYAGKLLMVAITQNQGQQLQQIKYILLAGIVGFTGGITNFFPQLFNVYPFGNFFVMFYVFVITYAIIRHRLLDIRLVITRSLVYGVLLTLVTLSFVFITFLSAQFFNETSSGRALVSILVAALIVFGLDPLKRLLSVVTDKVFFKAKVDYQAVLRELSEVLSVEINLDRLVSQLEVDLAQELKLMSATVLLRRKGDAERFGAGVEGELHNSALSLAGESSLMGFLRDRKGTILLETLERVIEDTPENKRKPLENERVELERLQAALVAPVFSQNKMNAVLVLGPKLSGDSFSNDDLQLIEVLSPQIGSAIQKANLYEEVRRFGESLKVKVEEATVELQERNVSLQTLQTITKEITRTLDFNQVVQRIANSVAAELGYLGAILVFLDDDGKTVRARAITETPLTKKALQLLPIHFNDYTSDITDPRSGSLGHQVIKSGEMRMTDDFAAVISPPVPRLLALTIQKLVGIKSVVLIPIISEGKTIGVIEIGTRKKPADITKQEIATMQSLADELGVVSRNLKLFDQIRKTNAQLEVANEHLQELDRAKSEFVSIASHQLRTPMTGIMGYLSMMTQGDFGKLAPEHQKILTDLLSESQRMIRLINQFLNVSKIEAGKFTYTKAAVHVEELIRREIEETAKAAKDKKLKLTTALPKTPLPTVIADGDKLQDVILNLIDNAIKYTSAGAITVGAESLDDHPSTSSGQAIHVWVSDSGIGIKKEDAPELFNKFVRGSGIAQIHPDGSGLGLFIAKSIIDAHGGRIWVESKGEGKGSTFQFVIPVTPPVDVVAPSHEAAAHVVSAKRV